MKNDALKIINAAIKAANPYDNTKKWLESLCAENENYTVFSIGKAAVPMARAAEDVLGARIKNGLLVTKYEHSRGFNPQHFTVIEAGHPLSDKNSEAAAEKALKIAAGLCEKDTLIVLLSGGGSALLEKSSITAEAQRAITQKLLARGAEIDEINAVRKRLSLVKGGRLAGASYPAKTITVALSDVLSNDKGVIASGVTVPDETNDDFVRQTVNKYLYDEPPENTARLFYKEDIKINDGGYYFAGDVNSLCTAAAKTAEMLGYKAVCVTRSLKGEAKERAKEIIMNARTCREKTAFIYGGETTVTLKGSGKGGRNQEMALAAAIELKGSKNIFFASCGSDGTDGPTDAAGGFSDGDTYYNIEKAGLSPCNELENNNSYYALKSAGALIITGPTGTNVNDITIALCNIENTN